MEATEHHTHTHTTLKGKINEKTSSARVHVREAPSDVTSLAQRLRRQPVTPKRDDKQPRSSAINVRRSSTAALRVAGKSAQLQHNICGKKSGNESAQKVQV